MDVYRKTSEKLVCDRYIVSENLLLFFVIKNFWENVTTYLRERDIARIAPRGQKTSAKVGCFEYFPHPAGRGPSYHNKVFVSFVEPRRDVKVIGAHWDFMPRPRIH